MSDGLSEVSQAPPHPPSDSGAQRAWTRPGLRRAGVSVAAVLALSGALGWAAGHLWWRWWSPAPDGTVYETSTGLVWLANPVDAGSAHVSSATMEYVVVGVGLGLVLGVLVGFLSRGWELIGLVAGLLGAGLAAYLMTVVGTDLSPPDPQTLVEEAGAGASLPGAMQVAGWSPYLSWPFGLLAGHLGVIFLAPPRQDRSAQSVG